MKIKKFHVPIKILIIRLSSMIKETYIDEGSICKKVMKFAYIAIILESCFQINSNFDFFFLDTMNESERKTTHELAM